MTIRRPQQEDGDDGIVIFTGELARFMIIVADALTREVVDNAPHQELEDPLFSMIYDQIRSVYGIT